MRKRGRGWRWRRKPRSAPTSVLLDTGFQASSLASAGADVVAEGLQRFAAVVQGLEANEGWEQGPHLALGQLQQGVPRLAELSEVGEIGNSDGWVTRGW